jgi:hypothetical protein
VQNWRPVLDAVFSYLELLRRPVNEGGELPEYLYDELAQLTRVRFNYSEV